MKELIDNVKLISEVYKYNPLYNTKNAHYFDSDMKNEIWSQIGLILNTSPEACKARWKNLRTCFVNDIKKSELYANQERKCKQYQYYDNMKFLLPYLKKGRPNSPENKSVYEDLHIDNKKFIDVQEFSEEENDDSIETDPINIDDNIEKIIIRPHSITKNQEYENNNNESLKLFFLSMYNTVKNFKPDKQISIKKELFNTVTEYEEKILKENYK